MKEAGDLIPGTADAVDPALAEAMIVGDEKGRPLDRRHEKVMALSAAGPAL